MQRAEFAWWEVKSLIDLPLVWKLALDFASSISAEEWSLLHATQSWQYQNSCPPEFFQKVCFDLARLWQRFLAFTYTNLQAKIMPNYPIWARDSYAFAVLLDEAGVVLTDCPKLKELLLRMKAADPLVRPDMKAILAVDYFTQSKVVSGMMLCLDIRDKKLAPAQLKAKFQCVPKASLFKLACD